VIFSKPGTNPALRESFAWANYFRRGASKATFSAVDNYFVWGWLMRWIRAKYAGKTGLSMKELRRRFCDQGWWLRRLQLAPR
jgi:RNA-directed DNA polymerase